MFVPGAIPKGAPYQSSIRPSGDFQHAPMPPPTLKSQVQQRPHQQQIDRGRNPLLREVDDELRRLKTQFDTIRNENSKFKPTSNISETVEAHHYTNNPSSALKGVINYQPQQPSNKPSTSVQQPPFGLTSSGNSNSQPTIDLKPLAGMPYGQNKKIVQSFPQFGILVDLDAYIEDPPYPDGLSISDFVASASEDFSIVKKLVLESVK